MRVRILLVLLLAALPLAPAVGQEVIGRIQQALDRAEDALGQSFARSLPLPTASAGVSYSFDAATGNFQRDPATFGQIYLDRADPLGRGRSNISFSYQYTELDELEGMDANDLRDPLPIPFEGLFGAMEIPRFRVKAAVHSFLVAFSYGLTDSLDASIAVPVLYSDIRIRTDVSAAAVTEEGEVLLLDEHLDESTHPVGIGDVVLRAKYRALELADVHVAGGLLLRLPAGDKDDLQGTGYVEVTPSLIASTRVFEPTAWARLQGHANAAVGFNSENVDASEARWGIGLDWRATDEITVASAFLGRHPFARVGEPGSTLFTRCNTDLVTCAADPNARDTVAPLFGLSADRADSYILSIGGRGSVWRDMLFAFANVAIPLNDGFVRTEPIPVIGIEATF